MIGDWTNVTKPNGTVLATKCEREDYDFIEGNEDKINPVPITAEILEKNNFSDVDNSSINRQIGFVHWYHVDRIGALEEPLITQDLNSGTYSLVYKDNQAHALRYVHELQHAFRLFWLNDLADKFTV